MEASDMPDYILTEGGSRILKNSEGGSWTESEAVSYTHLDVYKRQALISLKKPYSATLTRLRGRARRRMLCRKSFIRFTAYTDAGRS